MFDDITKQYRQRFYIKKRCLEYVYITDLKYQYKWPVPKEGKGKNKIGIAQINFYTKFQIVDKKVNLNISTKF